ncbi:MAG: hypothetical protein NTZ17_01720 [Phycisphaerae bacterium]|nr:hypothetical protein [Phycisphaerae bacterium]
MKRQMKAIRRGLLTAVMILATVGLPARGQYAGGSGTANDPYLIATAQQLNAIGLREADWNKHFRLTADIDMNDLGETPVNLIFFFQGVFDGNHHTIANLIYRVKDEDGQPGSPYVTVIGLFRVLSGWDALVQNLGLIDPNVRPDPTCTRSVNGVGALAGSLKQGWIRNCYVKGGHVAGSSTVGGLVADCSSDAAVSECWSSADVSGSRTVGGLIGYVARASVWSCHVAASVSGAMNVGGLVGVVQKEDSTIEDCFTAGTVTGSEAGGLVGYLTEGSVSRCYSTASLSGGSSLGGLVGKNHGLIHTSWAGGEITGGMYVGGLVGQNVEGDGIFLPYFDTQVTDSYATGSVRGDNVIGGLIGSNEGTLLRCYSTGAVTASGAVPASSVKYSGRQVRLQMGHPGLLLGYDDQRREHERRWNWETHGRNAEPGHLSRRGLGLRRGDRQWHRGPLEDEQ